MMDVILLYLLTFIILCIAFYGPMVVIKNHLYRHHGGKKEITVADCFKFILQFIKFTIVYPIYVINGYRAIFKCTDDECKKYDIQMRDSWRDRVDIVVVIYQGIFWYKNIAVFSSGIDLLLDKLGDRAVIHRCYTRDDVKEVIMDRYNNRLWIFGHGRRYRLEFGDEILYYEEMKDYPHKEYIQQLHCNPYGGKSLVDYLCDDTSSSWVSDGDVFAFENREYIRNWKVK